MVPPVLADDAAQCCSPRPYRLFQSLVVLVEASGHMRLLVAERSGTGGEKKMIAGSILLQLGQTAFHAFTGCAPDDWGYTLMTFCRWKRSEVPAGRAIVGTISVRWRRSTRRWLSSRRSGAAGPSLLYRYYSPAPLDRSADGPSRLARSARRVWRHLPAHVTAVLGDWIYGRM